MAERPLHPLCASPLVVVVQPEGPRAFEHARVSVGVKLWRQAGRRLTVIVKAAFAYTPEGDESGAVGSVARVAAPPALVLRRPEDEAAAASPSDFAPRKASGDVLVVGSAHAQVASQRIACELALGSLRRTFAVASERPAFALALTSGLESADGSGMRPLGPGPTPAEREDHPDHFDYAHYQLAAPEQQLAGGVAPDATLELVGLSRHGAKRRIALPGLYPLVTLERPPWGPHTLAMRCDCLWLDTDAERIELTWRGDCDAPEEARDVSRIVVALERLGDERSHEAMLPDLQRGDVAYAVREQDLLPGAPPVPRDDATLMMARYETWGTRAPEPRLLLADYAAIAAEIAEGRDSRDTVLERYGLDADRWVVEERAWLEKLANDALEGDAALAAEYGAQFIKAQDALARPAEKKRLAADYAVIVCDMEDSLDPRAVLDRHALSLAEWLRLDRRWKKAAASDPSVAAEIERAMAAYRAETGTAGD